MVQSASTQLCVWGAAVAVVLWEEVASVDGDDAGFVWTGAVVFTPVLVFVEAELLPQAHNDSRRANTMTSKSVFFIINLPLFFLRRIKYSAQEYYIPTKYVCQD